jgi:hypothetical protein
VSEQQRRWDIVLRVVSGPLASRQPVSYRGPQVTVGVDPGPGGVVLPGGRGVAPRHCTIAAYDPHTIFVTPIGHNPVRIAPYAEVRWDQIEPIRQQVRLERGNAIHLGPTGSRGITLEFVECRDLGMQSVVRIASEAAGDAVLPRPPDAIQARREPRVTSLLADVVPRSRFQQYLLGLFAMSFVMLLAAAGILVARMRATAPDRLPPSDWNAYEFQLDADLTVHEGFQEPFWDFVLAWNAEKARGITYDELDRDHPQLWDQAFFGTVEQLVRRSAASRHIFKRLEEIADKYAYVTEALDDNDMPLVFAAIPIVESCYRPDLTSPCCAKGFWQWMPEAGPRFSAQLGDSFAIRDCAYEESPGRTYTPKDKAPPPNSCKFYQISEDTNRCKLADCAVDFRTRLDLSTQASLISLAQAFDDEEIAGSGAAVQITIASHNAGYEDTLLRSDVTVRSKRYNLLHAYRRWYRSGEAGTTPPNFYGDVMRCVRDGEVEGCGKYMVPETQMYAPRVVADHLLAVCYYATHHADVPAFARWRKYLRDGGYCTEIEIPEPTELTGLPRSQWCH